MSSEDKREFSEEVIADHVVMSQAGANSVRAEEVRMQQAGAMSIEADKVEMEQSGALIIRSRDVELTGGGGWVVVADNLTANDSSTGFLVARTVEGNVRTLFDVKTAIGIGAGMGLVLLLFGPLLRWVGGRRG